MYNLVGHPELNRERNHLVAKRYDWIRGSHAFKFGYEILRIRLNSANFARFSRFAFDGVDGRPATQRTAVAQHRHHFCRLSDGLCGQATFNSRADKLAARSTIHSFYIQDDWKITPR